MAEELRASLYPRRGSALAVASLGTGRPVSIRPDAAAARLVLAKTEARIRCCPCSIKAWRSFSNAYRNVGLEALETQNTSNSLLIRSPIYELCTSFPT